ncbi:MAG: hypothetical protein ACR2IE_08475 [Candidatus Sumerlaeaceae bacterium]
MGLTRTSVLEYAHAIPGIAARDCLFAALHRAQDLRACERCEILLSDFSSIPYAGGRQKKMLRRLLTMIRILQQEEPQELPVAAGNNGKFKLA